MNWTDSILHRATCPVCGNRLRDEGDRLVCDQCGYPDNEDDNEDEVEITCDVCGEIVDPASCPTCPVCGVALCGDKECAEAHIAKHHPEWDKDDDDDDDLGRCDDCDRDGDCDHCPGHPVMPVDLNDPENVPFTPIPVGSSTDEEFLKSEFSSRCQPRVSEGGRLFVIDASGLVCRAYYPAVDGTIWCQENGSWKKCGALWRKPPREDKDGIDDDSDNDNVVACHQCGTKLLYENSISCTYCGELFCSRQCLDEHLFRCHEDQAVDFADGEAIDFVTAGTPAAATLAERINAGSLFCLVEYPEWHNRVMAVAKPSGDHVCFDKFGQAYRLCPGYKATWGKTPYGVGTLDPNGHPECAECGAACDRGVVSAVSGAGVGNPFCSSACLDKYRSKR